MCKTSSIPTASGFVAPADEQNFDRIEAELAKNVYHTQTPMKYLPTIASVLLGLLFLMASVTFFLHMVPEQKLAEGSPAALFTGAFGPTGYMHMVKAFELIGAILV